MGQLAAQLKELGQASVYQHEWLSQQLASLSTKLHSNCAMLEARCRLLKGEHDGQFAGAIRESSYTPGQIKARCDSKTNTGPYGTPQSKVDQDTFRPRGNA